MSGDFSEYSSTRVASIRYLCVRHGRLGINRCIQQVSQNIIDQDGKNDTAEGKARTGWTEPGPRAITGPSKLYMKGVCKYRPWVDASEEGRRVDGNDSRGGGGRSDRPEAEDGDCR